MLARTLNQKPPIGANFLPQPKSAVERAEDRWFLREKPLLSTTTVSDKTVPGQYFDAETNLHYNYYRYYDPELGRYITSDPIGLMGGVNTYGYALQNSINNIDPSGLFVPIIFVPAAVEATINVVGAIVIMAAAYNAGVYDDNVIPFPDPQPTPEPDPDDCPDGDGPDDCELRYGSLSIEKIRIMNNMTKTAIDDLTKQRWNRAASKYNKECVPKGFPILTSGVSRN